MDAEAPYFYFTINPKLVQLSFPLSMWQELPARRVPDKDRDKQNLYPRLGRERESLEYLFNPRLAQ